MRSDAVTQVEFTHDGATLVSGSRDGTMRYWHVQSGEAKEDEEARVLAGGEFTFAKGGSREQKVGKFLITAEGDILRIFKSEVKAKADKDNTPVAFFRAPAPISSVDASGAHIAVGCYNGEVLQLRAAVLCVLHPRTHTIRALSFAYSGVDQSTLSSPPVSLEFGLSAK
jgi:hypothetical protein